MTRIFTPGDDYSHYQSDKGVTPKRYFDSRIDVTKGHKFSFVKASELQWSRSQRKYFYKDPSVDEFAWRLRESGILFGFYHFARPAIYGHNAMQQADAFWDIVKDYNASLPLVLDAEVNGVGLSYIKSFLERIEELSGKTPILYTSPSFWSGLNKSEHAVWVKKYPLWIAHYLGRNAIPYPAYSEMCMNGILQTATRFPSVPAPFEKWTFWQYTDLGDGEFYGGNYASWTDETGLDLNVFNGTLEELYEFAGENGVPEPPPPVKPKTHLYVTGELGDFLRIRDMPVYKEGIQTVIVEKGDYLKMTDSPRQPDPDPEISIVWQEVYVPGCEDCECAKKWVTTNSKYVKEVYLK